MSRVLNMIMIKYNLIFIFVFLGVISSCSYSDSITLFRADEERTLEKAFDIIEGEVLGGSIMRQTSPNACFSYVYSVKVNKSYKNNTRESQIINIGLNVNSIKVQPKQSQLIVLTEVPGSFYNYCDKGGTNQHNDIYTTFGYTIGVFELYLETNNVRKFKSISCHNKKPIMYENSTSEKVWLTKKCYQITGSYDDLSEKIQTDILKFKSTPTIKDSQ